MTAYYNEIDAYAAQWLRNLIAAGHIAPGDVDERSIVDVSEDDLRGYDQCHFFAGIGGWSLALRLAGWPDDRPVWTGSCPCQPFSAAGKRRGTDDERHLWPEFYQLIGKCRPAIVFGEQVASKGGRNWLAGVRTDLEALGYGVGAADLCAAGAGAPHIRQRLWWVADAGCNGAESGRSERERAPGGDEVEARQRERVWTEHSTGRTTRRLADADSERCNRLNPLLRRKAGRRDKAAQFEATGSGPTRRLADADQKRRDGRACASGPICENTAKRCQGKSNVECNGNLGGVVNADRATTKRQRQVSISLEPEQKTGRPGNATAWAGAEPIGCADGRARRVGPGVFPLAHGVPNRVGRLRAYGNAIVPQVAQIFIEAYEETRGE